jgi:hypothetical protein
VAEHPIQAPQELVQEWWDAIPDDTKFTEALQLFANCVAQWGADQELEACLRYAGDNGLSITRMRAARRPKPPSLKEQALEAFERFIGSNNGIVDDMRDGSLIRRAIEALPDE